VGNPYPADQRDIAWLYLVPNPDFHPDGDFGLTMYSLNNDGRAEMDLRQYRRVPHEMFDGIAPGSHANWARCCAGTRTRAGRRRSLRRRMAQRRHVQQLDASTASYAPAR
jgi:hypothetical protein